MASSAFITAVPGQKAAGAPKKKEYQDEINELEALVSGVTQTSQSTLLLKKKKEMREVSEALAFMKQQYLERMKVRRSDRRRRRSEATITVVTRLLW